MVGLGAAHGVRTTALLTQMDVPLGRTAGNALEVAESVEVLAGGGPADVVELTLALAREMLELVGLATPTPPPRSPTAGPWTPGDAMVRAQGGDPTAPLPRRHEVEVVTAPATGTLARLDAMARRAWRPGGSAPAGPARRTPCRPTAGVVWLATVGDHVEQGQPLLELHLDDPARLPAAPSTPSTAPSRSPRPPSPPRPWSLAPT